MYTRQGFNPVGEPDEDGNPGHEKLYSRFITGDRKSGRSWIEHHTVTNSGPGAFVHHIKIETIPGGGPHPYHADEMQSIEPMTVRGPLAWFGISDSIEDMAARARQRYKAVGK